MNSRVAIEPCSSYQADELYTSIKKTIEAAGDLDVKGKRLLLKPNIVFDAAPEKAVCTHPEFMAAAIRLFKDMGAKHIYAGDSPGLQMPGFSANVSGIGDAATKNGAEWVDFTREKAELSYPEAHTIKKFTLTKIIKDIDIIVNLPKLKTHQLMCYTGAMKNLFGLIPSAAKSSFHVRCPSQKTFASMIVDLNAAINNIEDLQVYNIMDAVIGMEGPGPAAGTPRQLGYVLSSPNALAMDIAACRIIAYPPELIPINKNALERKIWLNSITDIEYPLLNPSDLCVPDFNKIPIKKAAPQLLNFILPKPLRNLLESFAPRPVINDKVCMRCLDCEKICASRAITTDGKTNNILINYRDCIRCFCCHEICKFNAIAITKKPAGNK